MTAAQIIDDCRVHNHPVLGRLKRRATPCAAWRYPNAVRYEI